MPRISNERLKAFANNGAYPEIRNMARELITSRALLDRVKALIEVAYGSPVGAWASESYREWCGELDALKEEK
jgi:hypothetical protein